MQLKSHTKSGNPTLERLDVRNDCIIIGLTTTGEGELWIQKKVDREEQWGRLYIAAVGVRAEMSITC